MVVLLCANLPMLKRTIL